MYGLIGQLKAATGARDELIAILSENDTGMPGCRSYVVAKDTSDPNMIWITEVWDSAEQHKASLELETVRDAIRRARPLITGFGHRFETEPVSGWGG